MTSLESGTASTWRSTVSTTADPLSWAGITRLLLWCRQRVCGLRGHELILSSQVRRVSLCCSRCGFDTPGWTFDLKPPRSRFAGDPARHVLHDDGGRRIR